MSYLEIGWHTDANLHNSYRFHMVSPHGPPSSPQELMAQKGFLKKELL